MTVCMGVVQVLLPEKFSVDVVAGGAVKTDGKLEGDVKIVSEGDGVSVAKVRGEFVDLEAADVLNVRSVVEGRAV